MRFSQFVEELSWRTGLPQDDIRRVVAAFMDVVAEKVLMKNEDVKITNFGVFYQGTHRESGEPVLKFRRSAYAMDKYSVVLEDGEQEKTGSVGSTCPTCGSTLDSQKHCPNCGTKPWEKKQDEDKK